MGTKGVIICNKGNAVDFGPLEFYGLQAGYLIISVDFSPRFKIFILGRYIQTKRPALYRRQALMSCPPPSAPTFSHSREKLILFFQRKRGPSLSSLGKTKERPFSSLSLSFYLLSFSCFVWFPSTICVRKEILHV